MKILSVAIIVASFFLLSCQPAQPGASAETPEQVVREWQRLVDKNHFQEAMKYCTEITRENIKVYGLPFEGQPSDVQTNFASVSCKEQGNEAICKCSISVENSSETYEDEFHLIKQDGKWLIDIPAFDVEGDEGDIEGEGESETPEGKQ
jgi:hypothetical protein